MTTVGGMQVLRGDLKTVVELIGSTAPDDLINVAPSMPAIVDQVKVAVGDYVEEGDVLFVLDPESVESQVTQAKIAVTMAQVGVQNAQAAVEQTSLAYDSAKSNYEMSMANYNFGADNLANYEKLYEQGAVSKAELDQMRLNNSDETLNLLQKQLDQSSAAITQSKLGVQSASAGLAQAREGLKTAEDALEDMTITAPASGYITSNNVSVDNMTPVGQPAMVIQSMDTITVSASVTESLVSKLAIGDQVLVKIDALEREGMEGTIATLSSAADPMTLLFPMTVEVDNKDNAIKPGMFATIEVVRSESQNTIYVPAESVIIRDGRYYLLVFNGENKASRVEVTTGIDNGHFTEILSGVTAEDIIVTKGMGLVDEDSMIRLIRSDI